jgi:hypothetical protein
VSIVQKLVTKGATQKLMDYIAKEEKRFRDYQDKLKIEYAHAK